jgi:hypothetical protein
MHLLLVDHALAPGPHARGLVNCCGRPPEHAFGAALAGFAEALAVAEAGQP